MSSEQTDLVLMRRNINSYRVRILTTIMSLLASLSVRSLLLLRLALDTEQESADIEQDIRDLYLFPERLVSSYPDEWRAYIKRELAKLNINEPRVSALLSGASAHDIHQEQLLFHKLRNAKLRYERLSHVIDDVESASASSNVAILQTPLHKWLAWAIS